MSLLEELNKELNIKEKSVVSITGAGGKTTTMKALGSYYKNKGYSVLLTTTTKVQSPKLYNYDTDYTYMYESDILSHEVKKGESVFYAERNLMDPKKLLSPRIEILSLLIKRFDIILVEADGSKGLPLKFHTERDPVILEETTHTIALLGSACFNDYSDNVCFGYENRLIVDAKFIQNLIDHPQGVLKGAKGKTIILINASDLLDDKNVFTSLVCEYPIFLGSVLKDEICLKK